MSIDQYSSTRIAKASEFELEQMLKQFKNEQVSIKKFGGFIAFNFIALAGMLGTTAWYVKSNWVKKGQPRKYNPKDLTIPNIMKKGSKIGVVIGGLYVLGFLAVGHYTMPIEVFKKYSEIQQALHAFEIKYDPFYQEILLFRKMKKFGLSDGLIADIKNDLNRQKQYLINNHMLKAETVQAIKKSEEIYLSDLGKMTTA